MSDAGRRWAIVASVLLVLLGVAAIWICAGGYNIAADVPHMLETIRDRLVATRAQGVVVPNNLDDPSRISAVSKDKWSKCPLLALSGRANRADECQL